MVLNYGNEVLFPLTPALSRWEKKDMFTNSDEK